MCSRKEMNVFEELIAGENPIRSRPRPDHGCVVADAEPHRPAWRGWYSPPDAIDQLIFANAHFWHAIRSL
jgi:hypothetical protein